MFKHRSNKKELLDGDSIPELDLFQNLKELDRINFLLGGYAITFSALKKIMNKGKIYTLVDIGCGGGDTLKRINIWRRSKGYHMNLYGIDLKSTCVDYALINKPDDQLKFICDDYRNVNKHLKVTDIIHACLFCHHLTEDEIVGLILFAQRNKCTLLINDLQRHPIAYYAIKILTNLFSNSYLVKNDAQLSVLRGFKKKEWLAIISKAGVTNYSITYKWAFRYEVIVYSNEKG